MRPIILVVACFAVFFVWEGLANDSTYRIATVKSLEQVEGFRLVTELAPEVAWLTLVSTPSPPAPTFVRISGSASRRPPRVARLYKLAA